MEYFIINNSHFYDLELINNHKVDSASLEVCLSLAGVGNGEKQHN